MAAPRTLDDLVRVSVSASRAQWEQIGRRKSFERGHRQVDFVPVEVVLCHGASQLVEHRHFGGSTADDAPEPVQLVAKLFRRPPSSVLAKMANLDGSRPHGAKFDHPAGIVWTADPDTFERSYAAAILGARRCRIGPDALPDFLAPGWAP